jgi:hypothetical protein
MRISSFNDFSIRFWNCFDGLVFFLINETEFTAKGWWCAYGKVQLNSNSFTCFCFCICTVCFAGYLGICWRITILLKRRDVICSWQTLSYSVGRLCRIPLVDIHRITNWWHSRQFQMISWLVTCEFYHISTVHLVRFVENQDVMYTVRDAPSKNNVLLFT